LTAETHEEKGHGHGKLRTRPPPSLPLRNEGTGHRPRAVVFFLRSHVIRLQQKFPKKTATSTPHRVPGTSLIIPPSLPPTLKRRLGESSPCRQPVPHTLPHPLTMETLKKIGHEHANTHTRPPLSSPSLPLRNEGTGNSPRALVVFPTPYAVRSSPNHQKKGPRARRIAYPAPLPVFRPSPFESRHGASSPCRFPVHKTPRCPFVIETPPTKDHEHAHTRTQPP